MKRLTALVAIMTIAAIGCEKPGSSSDGLTEARDALPTSQNLAINVPAGSSGLQKVGDVSVAYLLTRTVATMLNGGAAWVLITAKTITDFPVTSISGDTYIWGPWSEALKPGEYRMTVRLTTDGDYAWALEGRKKGTTAAFQAVVSGLATPGHPHRGSGSFMMDFDVAKAIDPFGTDGDGTLSVTYDLERSPITIMMDAEKMAPAPGGGTALQTFHYAYSEKPDQSGSLTFSSFGDTDDPGPAWENTTYDASWLASGAGRADITISGGDLGEATVTAAECWSATFQRTYFGASVSWLPTEGVATSCSL
jgi:hypothetical protein